MKSRLLYLVVLFNLFEITAKSQTPFTNVIFNNPLDSNSSHMPSKVNSMKKNIYLLHGQGGDKRSFKNLNLDSAKYDVHFIKLSVPEKNDNLCSYAKKISLQIDTSKMFYLIGVSLGGMIAVELNEIINPEKVIIISSAKNYKELPFQYRFQRKFPLYKLVPAKFIKSMAFIAQPLFEPDRRKEKQTCVDMLRDKDAVFLKRSIGMIIRWNRTECGEGVVHIHGTKDHTIPIRNLSCDHIINKGSHMMILTRTEEIQSLIELILESED